MLILREKQKLQMLKIFKMNFHLSLRILCLVLNNSNNKNTLRIDDTGTHNVNAPSKEVVRGFKDIHGGFFREAGTGGNLANSEGTM